MLQEDTGDFGGELDFREKLSLANTESDWETYVTVGGFGHGVTGCVGPVGRVCTVGLLVLRFILLQLRDPKKHVSQCPILSGGQ